MKKLMLVLFAGVSLFAASCTKTGPVGPQGPTGNANVIGEDAFTVSTWIPNTTTNPTSYSATFSDPNLTADVYNYGSFELYKFYNSLGWTNLPDLDGKTTTVFNFRQGYFDIYVYNTDNSVVAYPGTVTFRAVVIPSSFRQANPNTNWKNYNEAMKALQSSKAAGLK
ncbi:hypothetical protein CJD36_003480 [Flavipsychrobacter stenotrophus]|uniref:Collagen-like protein n=1 Tax=Flavipsychrobacter stenotrophus TaxID=2077091 RepID=A0A2S7T0U1_9BACT|nr:hypothetical protein [Flavipsychrobacter stenotrophus]PQJ12819.1 hypothetical protein CJD36_003480 [Flavipsychrobacter stenotrophus]